MVKWGSKVVKWGSKVVKWGSGDVKLGSEVVKWGSGDVKLGSEVVKWSGLVETQKVRTCVFFLPQNLPDFATKNLIRALILLLKLQNMCLFCH